MKAGTSWKAVLNMLSTAVMLRAGLVYKRFMISISISNDKLRRRGGAIVRELTGADPATVSDALERGAWDIRNTVLITSGVEHGKAERLLRASQGNLRDALARNDVGCGSMRETARG